MPLDPPSMQAYARVFGAHCIGIAAAVPASYLTAFYLDLLKIILKTLRFKKL